MGALLLRYIMRAHNQIHAKEEMKTMKKYTTIIMVNKEKTNFNKNYIVGK